MTPFYDYVIIGSGIAGLYAAILAREHGSVLVLTKGSIDDCNTRWAQGGIAAPIGVGDSPEKHLRDTIAAGAGLVDEEAARVLTSEAADRIRDLVALGVPFDTDHGEIALGREGAHSVPRIVHAGGDSTGMHIELTLSSVARLEGITVREWTIATELALEEGRVTGVVALDERTGERLDIGAKFVILATGGAGRLYAVSTNPEVATGDGIALAYRAGAEIADMEFIQFHPTALRMPGQRPFLISEAVRGEGGRLIDASGERFMPLYDERGELAPRDIVARAIVDRMERTSGDHVFLDVTHLEPGRVIARFPQIYSTCREAGLDITRQPIPVSPAAHYTMGGIRTNVWGETTLPGLYAAGECACTGVHGANRLASTSLLEGLVWGDAAGASIAARLAKEGPSPPKAFRAIPDWNAPGDAANEDPALLQQDWATIRNTMWNYVGIVRTTARLARAVADLRDLEKRILRFYQVTTISKEIVDLTHGVRAAHAIATAAFKNPVSRGCHYREN